MERKTKALLAALGIAASAANAQTPPDFVANEVVVTASRFEEVASAQPIGVQVIDEGQIRDSGALTLPELLSLQPAIYTRDSSGNPNRQIDVRGFGSFGDQNTLVLVDGQRLSENEQTPANLAAIPLSSVERVEIIRGGGGAVLYGAGASGGTINIVTRAPRPGQRDARASAGYGSYNTRAFAAGATLSGDRVGMSIDAGRYDSDNYRINNALTQTNAHVDLRWFGDRGPLALKFGHSEQDLRLPGSRTEAQLVTDRRGTSTPDDSGSLDADQVALSTTQAFAFGELAADFGYRERRLFSVLQPGFVDTRGRVVNAAPRLKIPSQILGRGNVLVAGVDWDRWDYDSTAFFGFSSDAVSTQENRAFYLKDTIELTNVTRLSAGFREQRSETTLEEVGFTPELVQHKTLRAYEIALRQALGASWSLYAKSGKSFRLANVDDNRFRTELLEPQTSQDGEVGADYASGPVRMRMAAYRMRLENEILFLPSSVLPPFGGNVNLPPTQRTGVELEAEFLLGRSWSAQASYTWASARFEEGNFGGADVSGRNLPLVPRHRAGLSVLWQPARGSSLAATVSYVGEQYFENDQSNTFGRRMPAYTVLDLTASRDFGSWRFAAGVYNALDEKYFSYGVVSGASFVAYPAAERNFLLSAEYRFGI